MRDEDTKIIDKFTYKMNPSKKSLLFDALLYIERNSNSQIDLEKIASKSFYSKYHFQREFKEL